MKEIEIPADVPKHAEQKYKENYEAITKGTGNLFIFAADQKIEHLNKDFYGPDIPAEVNNPKHLFEIATKGTIGAFATHLGLISQYGKKYPTINYIVKLNAKTNIIPASEKDPISNRLWTVQDVVEFQKNSNLPIRGVAYTIYLGSSFENRMLQKAAQVIYNAHKEGLVTILWMYPRGKNVNNEKNPDMIAGAAGVATSLGANFAKINPTAQITELQQATSAAGNTKLICSGGPKIDEETFLQNLHNQIHIGKTSGCAIGRNIFQRKLENAIAFTKAISAIVYEEKSVEKAIKLWEKK